MEISFAIEHICTSAVSQLGVYSQENIKKYSSPLVASRHKATRKLGTIFSEPPDLTFSTIQLHLSLSRCHRHHSRKKKAPLTYDGEVYPWIPCRRLLEVDPAAVEAVVGAPHCLQVKTRLARPQVKFGPVLEHRQWLVFGLGYSSAPKVNSAERRSFEGQTLLQVTSNIVSGHLKYTLHFSVDGIVDHIYWEGNVRALFLFLSLMH